MGEGRANRAAVLDDALARLRSGELVVVPTETVYGLAADAARPEAVAKIFALKRRPPTRPLIVHLPGPAWLERWAARVPAEARVLAELFWPGPLTLVLPRTEHVPGVVTGGLPTVGLRVPGHPLTLELLERFGGGLAAPSANRYGRISPTTPAHVRAQFGYETPLVLEGGPARVGIESTIVAFPKEGPRVLRAGSISLEALADALGRPVSLADRATATMRAPGQDLAHYAPTTRTRLVAREALDSLEALRAALGRASQAGGDPEAARGELGRIGVLGFSEPGFPAVLSLRLPGEPEDAARLLYAALNELDEAGLDLIVVEEPPTGPAWLAIRDRLRRAASSEKAGRDDDAR